MRRVLHLLHWQATVPGVTKSWTQLSNWAQWEESGFPWWLSGRESACWCRRCRRRGFDPWVRKIPWRRKWQPAPVFLPGESHGQGSLVGYSLSGCHRVRHDLMTKHQCVRVIQWKSQREWLPAERQMSRKPWQQCRAWSVLETNSRPSVPGAWWAERRGGRRGGSGWPCWVSQPPVRSLDSIPSVRD